MSIFGKTGSFCSGSGAGYAAGARKTGLSSRLGADTGAEETGLAATAAEAALARYSSALMLRKNSGFGAETARRVPSESVISIGFSSASRQARTVW